MARLVAPPGHLTLSYSPPRLVRAARGHRRLTVSAAVSTLILTNVFIEVPSRLDCRRWGRVRCQYAKSMPGLESRPWLCKPLNWEENPGMSRSRNPQGITAKKRRAAARVDKFQSTPGEMLGRATLQPRSTGPMGAGRPFVQSQQRAYPMTHTHGKTYPPARRRRDERILPLRRPARMGRTRGNTCRASSRQGLGNCGANTCCEKARLSGCAAGDLTG